MSTNSIDTEIERINRLKVVLVEKWKANNWLASELGVSVDDLINSKVVDL